jgi:hypothetical protein
MNGSPSDSKAMLRRPCWYCHWWGGTSGSAHSLCERPGGTAKKAQPRTGCAFYEREPGVDDDDWSPTWQAQPELKAPARGSSEARNNARPIALILDAPDANPEQVARGLVAAAEVFAAAGVDVREAWGAFTASVRGEACSTWVLAEMVALETACGAGALGRLAFTDDD